MNIKKLNEEYKKLVEEKAKEYLSDEDKERAELVNLDNLTDCYYDPSRNLYVNNELVDGFSEEDVRNAINNNCEVYCL